MKERVIRDFPVLKRGSVVVQTFIRVEVAERSTPYSCKDHQDIRPSSLYSEIHVQRFDSLRLGLLFTPRRRP